MFVECIDFKCKLGSAGSRINRIAPTTPVTNNIYHLIKANYRCIAFRENINHLPVIPRLSANGKYFAKSSQEGRPGHQNDHMTEDRPDGWPGFGTVVGRSGVRTRPTESTQKTHGKGHQVPRYL